MTEFDAQLKDTVRHLGATLGATIKHQLGEEWLARIETIRKAGREANKGNTDSRAELQALFAQLDDSDLLVIGRAFAQFLNLGNIAEQEHNSAKQIDVSMETLFEHIERAKLDNDAITSAVADLNIDLVLTAHPTEVTRRTLIHKHSELAKCLASIHQEPSDRQREKLQSRMADLIAQAWHTEEIRTVRPTPVDEARWGFSVIENSLWDAVPSFLRDFDSRLQSHYTMNLPLDAKPVQFSSWMGGDRDGNPFVTSKVTEQVLLLARKRAAKLFAIDLDKLQVELSMSACNQALRDEVGDALEPYRALLRPLVSRLRFTRDDIDRYLNGKPCDPDAWIADNEELLEPLM